MVALFLFLLLLCPVFSSEWTIEAEGLYWKANEEGLSYAVVRSEIASDVLKTPDFERDFGFKLGMGYFFPSNQYNILIRLTHLHTHADSLLHAKNEQTLYPVWITSQEISPLSAEEIKMHWRLHMALIDALVGKDLHPSTHFIFLPQLGLRYATVRQKFNLAYRGGMFIPSDEEYVRMKNKFSGVGPYGSLGVQWLVSRHLSLCATGGLSCPYGEFYLHENEDLFEGQAKILGFRDIWMRIAVIADASIVLRWQKVWEKGKKKLSFQAGWDAMLLFKQNRLVRFFEASPLENPGNLGLNGWEWGVRLNF